MIVAGGLRKGSRRPSWSGLERKGDGADSSGSRKRSSLDVVGDKFEEVNDTPSSPLKPQVNREEGREKTGVQKSLNFNLEESGGSRSVPPPPRKKDTMKKATTTCDQERAGSLEECRQGQ